MKKNILKILFSLFVIYIVYLAELPIFPFVILIVVFMGWGNLHIGGKKREKKSAIERWYTGDDEANKS